MENKRNRPLFRVLLFAAGLPDSCFSLPSWGGGLGGLGVVLFCGGGGVDIGADAVRGGCGCEAVDAGGGGVAWTGCWWAWMGMGCGEDMGLWSERELIGADAHGRCWAGYGLSEYGQDAVEGQSWERSGVGWVWDF